MVKNVQKGIEMKEVSCNVVEIDMVEIIFVSERKLPAFLKSRLIFIFGISASVKAEKETNRSYM